MTTDSRKLLDEGAMFRLQWAAVAVSVMLNLYYAFALPLLVAMLTALALRKNAGGVFAAH